MIIGVALVVDELHKGQRLAFRYPEVIPSCALFVGESMLRYHEEYMALSPDNFAKLFRPKQAFFNKVLEITIGDISYISYPSPCSVDAAQQQQQPQGSGVGIAPGSGGGSNSATSSSGTGSGDVSPSFAYDVASSSTYAVLGGDSDGSDNESPDSYEKNNTITMFNVVVARVREGVITSPSAPALSTITGYGADYYLSLGYGANSLHLSPPGVDPIAALMGLSGTSLPVPPAILKDAVSAYSRALAREQLRCKYVSREVALMISLQDATSGSGNRHSASIGAGTSVAGSRAPSPSTIGESDPQLPPTLSLQRSRSLASNASVHTDIEASHPDSTATLISSTVSGAVASHDSRSSYIVDSSSLTIFPPAPLSVRERSDESSLSIGSSSSGSVGGAASGRNGGPGTPTYSSVVSGRILWSNAINILSQGTSTNPTKSASTLLGLSHHPSSPLGHKTLTTSPDSDMLVTVPISEFILLRSALANELRLLYHSLLAGAFLNMSVNGCLSLSMKLQPTVDCNRLRDSYRPFQSFLPIGSEENIRDIIVALQEQSNLETSSLENSSFADLFWTRESHRNELDSKAGHSMLSNADSQTNQSSSSVNKKNPETASSPKGRFWNFLSHSQPTVTLQDIAQSLEEPIEEIYYTVECLERLGVGKVITCISGSQVYSVHPLAPLDINSRASRTFAGMFGSKLSCDLCTVLSQFDGVKTLQEVSESVDEMTRLYLIDVVVWLLRWNMIIELHIYLFDAMGSLDAEGIILTDKDKELHNRLKKYCNARHRLVEILWNESDLTQDEILSFVSRHSVSIVKRL